MIHSEVSEVLEEFRSGHGATETYYREDGNPEGVPAEIAHDVISEVIGKINEQQKFGEWIPCSERLPDLHRVDMESEGEYFMISDSVIITDGENIGITKYEVDDDDSKGWLACECEEIGDVIAWKPLPEPYKLGEE